mmetsp:Transcript_12759/g.26100  ORF Transcript_12759/g.26100 Transcript_12759/m.26100 type:complete len:386 (-) Transcript_12759:124-1281(-)
MATFSLRRRCASSSAFLETSASFCLRAPDASDSAALFSVSFDEGCSSISVKKTSTAVKALSVFFLTAASCSSVSVFASSFSSCRFSSSSSSSSRPIVSTIFFKVTALSMTMVPQTRLASLFIMVTSSLLAPSPSISLTLQKVSATTHKSESRSKLSIISPASVPSSSSIGTMMNMRVASFSPSSLVTFDPSNIVSLGKDETAEFLCLDCSETGLLFRSRMLKLWGGKVSRPYLPQSSMRLSDRSSSSSFLRWKKLVRSMCLIRLPWRKSSLRFIVSSKPSPMESIKLCCRYNSVRLVKGSRPVTPPVILLYARWRDFLFRRTSAVSSGGRSSSFPTKFLSRITFMVIGFRSGSESTLFSWLVAEAGALASEGGEEDMGRRRRVRQ